MTLLKVTDTVIRVCVGETLILAPCWAHMYIIIVYLSCVFHIRALSFSPQHKTICIVHMYI